MGDKNTFNYNPEKTLENTQEKNPKGTEIKDELKNLLDQVQYDKELMIAAKEMRDTENYPMAQFVKSPNADELARRNNTAKEGFKQKFEEGFKNTEITTNDGSILNFNSIKYNTNYNSYNLIFSYHNGDREQFIHLTCEGNKISQVGSDPKLEFDFENQKKLQNMLMYHSQNKIFNRYNQLENKQQQDKTN